MKVFRLSVISIALVTLISPHAVIAGDGENITTLDTVYAKADSVQAFYLMLPPLVGFSLTGSLDQIDPIGSEQNDCEKLQGMSFLLGCSVNGAQERNVLRGMNSYSAGSSMYQLLEYQSRGDTGLFAASDLNSALNAFELAWSNGGDLQRISQDFHRSIFEICDSQFTNGAPMENVNACIRASGQFLTEMANYINPQTRNTWIDQVLADTMQVRPVWNGLTFSVGYRGISASFNLDLQSIPSAIPGYKENLFRDWTCQKVRQQREDAGCPIA